MKKTPLVLTAAFLLAGCSAAKNLIPGASCKWSTTGAETDSGVCTATAATNAGKTELAIAGTPTGSFELDGAGATFVAPFAPGDFSSTASSTTNGAVIFQNASVTQQWGAIFDSASAVANQGSYSFTLTSVAPGVAPQTFTVHGSLTATMVPTVTNGNQAPTGSTVNISVTF